MPNSVVLRELSKQKKRLTYLLTLMIFFIIFIIELTFLLFKYYNYNRSLEISLNKRLNSFLTNDFLFDQFINYDINRDISFRQSFWYLNLMITNDDWRLIYSSLNDIIFNIALLNKFNNEDYIMDWFLTLQHEANTFIVAKKYKFYNWKWYNIYIFDSLDYNWVDFFYELFQFVSLTWFFSILLYFLWYLFVSRNLRPVEENILDMENFIHNAWHELKTPLAVLSSNLQLSLITKDYEELVKDSLEEINRMNHLINWLLSLSSITENVENEKIFVNKVIKDIIKEFYSKIKEKNLNIDFLEKDELFIFANYDFFMIFFSNLLSNSIKYNNDWWSIKVEVWTNFIIIQDSWIWMKNEELNKIFERFYQIKENRTVEWFWIWLSLVKKISDLYKRKIQINSEYGKWTIVTIFFN